MNTIMTGAEAKVHLNHLQGYMKSRRNATKEEFDAAGEKARGYFKNGHLWTAFDDRTAECFVEDFESEADAISWLNEAPVWGVGGGR